MARGDGVGGGEDQVFNLNPIKTTDAIETPVGTTDGCPRLGTSSLPVSNFALLDETIFQGYV
jgi:hypothetical protein